MFVTRLFSILISQDTKFKRASIVSGDAQSPVLKVMLIRQVMVKWSNMQTTVPTGVFNSKDVSSR